MQTYVLYDAFDIDQVVESVCLPYNVVPIWWVDPFNFDPRPMRRLQREEQGPAEIIDLMPHITKRKAAEHALRLRLRDVF